MMIRWTLDTQGRLIAEVLRAQGGRRPSCRRLCFRTGYRWFDRWFARRQPADLHARRRAAS